MPQQTDIHGWDIPTPDEDEDWGVILNEFFDGDLDREVILFGQSHERPAAGADAPHLFFDVDKDQLDYNDGTQWIDAIIPPDTATYVTTADETAALPNSAQHSNLSGTDLHDPSVHATSHESGGADEITHNNLAISSNDHHAKYTDTEAVSAVESTNTLGFGLETAITGGYASFIEGQTARDPFMYDGSHNLLWWGDKQWTLTVNDSTGVTNPQYLFRPGDNWVKLDMSSTVDPLTFTLEGFSVTTSAANAFRGLIQGHRAFDYDGVEIEIKGNDGVWYTLDSWTGGTASDGEPHLTARTGQVSGLSGNHPYQGIRLTLSNKTVTSGNNYLEYLGFINGKISPAWSGIYLTRGNMGDGDPQKMYSDLDMGDYNILAPNGQISEQGNRVATRVWANPEIAIEDSATSVLSGPVTLNLGSNLSVTDDGAGGVTVDSPPGGTSIASGTVTLSSGSAVVSTGVTTTGTNINVYLDPSGGGANAADVKASARAFWDNAAGEYKVEILEDGTSVGNPDIGYRVVRA